MPIGETAVKMVKEAPKIQIKDKKRAGIFMAKPRTAAPMTKKIFRRKSI